MAQRLHGSRRCYIGRYRRTSTSLLLSVTLLDRSGIEEVHGTLKQLPNSHDMGITLNVTIHHNLLEELKALKIADKINYQ